MMLEIEQVRNPATEFIESPRNKDSVKILDLLKNEKYINYLIYFYKVFFHIFIFSVFESFFFWFYITDQEDAALKNQFKQLDMLSNLICSNVDIDLDPFYEYLSEQRIQYNNDVPINNTIMLNTYLFCTLLLLNFLLKLSKINIVKKNIEIIKKCSFLFFLLFLYEYLFFKNVIYNYQPKSITEITKSLFNEC